MFMPNGQHSQMPMFSSIDSLPKKVLKRLKDSWAGTFYHEIFVRIDEKLFAGLYSDEPSRPNIPINVLVGLEVLKSGHGWSDEEMYNHFCYDIQVRYALGYRDLSEGHFELRTVYNFRQRVARHMQESGESLFEKVFEQITDEQIAAFELKTTKLRMDSTMIASNIREMTRVQLLVEVLQRVHRMLGKADRQRYAEEFEPYLKGSSGQYVYHLTGEDLTDHLQRIGELLERLQDELGAEYRELSPYRVLERVFQEHFIVKEAHLRPKEGQELSADSLQAPDDWEATYRQKGGEGYIGYTANVTETCHPDNEFQLIVKVQTEPNNTDDAMMLDEALPDLKERTGVEQMNTDGGYNSPDVDQTMREQGVEQIQSAIRGRKPAEERLGLEDFAWEVNAESEPHTVTCPNGQRAEVTAGRKEHRYRATFKSASCESCPLLDPCRTQPLKCREERVLRFRQRDVDVALRRQRTAEARASGQNLRAAVEATVRSIKHPFRNGKVPVRGQARVSIVMLGSAAMSNLRRIQAHLARQEKARRAEKANEKQTGRGHCMPAGSLFVSFLARLRRSFRPMNGLQPVLAHGI